MKIPYIKVYTADLLAKSRHLSDAQIGRALVGVCEQAFENQTLYKANDEAEGALFDLFMQWKNESVHSLKSRKRAGKIGAQARWSNTQLSDGSKRISSAISKCECQTKTESDTETGTDKEKIVKKETSVKRFIKPTLAEVKQYCESRKNGLDPEAFIAYYDSVGWKVNTKPMRDWKAAVITWEKRRQNVGGKSYGKDYNKRDADFSKYEGIGRTISSENA